MLSDNKDNSEWKPLYANKQTHDFSKVWQWIRNKHLMLLSNIAKKQPAFDFILYSASRI